MADEQQRSRSPAVLPREAALRAPVRLRGEGFAVALLLAVHGTLIWLQRAPGLTTGEDDAQYMLLARALREGAYRDLFLVNTPAHVKYPPGYPVVLAALGAMVGERYDVFLAWNILAQMMSLGLFYYMLRRRTSVGIAMCVLTLSALQPYSLAVAGIVRSEATFLLCIVLTLWNVEADRSARARTIMPPLMAAAAALTRIAGVAIAAGLGAYWLLRRDWRRLTISCAVMVIPIATWFAWSYRAQGDTTPSSYWIDIHQPAGSGGGGSGGGSSGGSGGGNGGGSHRAVPSDASRVAWNIRDYAIDAFPTTAPFPLIRGTRVDNLFWLAVTLLGLIPGAFVLFARWRAAAVVGAAYLGLLAVWIWSVPRFLLPVFPLLYTALLLGWEAVSHRLLRRPLFAPVLLTLCVGITALSALPRALRGFRECHQRPADMSSGCYTPEQSGLFSAAADLRERATPGEHALAAKVATFGMLTPLRFVPPRAVLAPDASQIRARVESYGIRYAFLSHLEVADVDLARVLSSVCHRLDLIGTYAGDAYLFAVRNSAAPPSDDRACVALRERQPDSTYAAGLIRW